MSERKIKSAFLSARQVQEMIAAIDFANKSGIKFNRWITINLEQCGVENEKRPIALRKFMGSLRRQNAKGKDEFAAVWVRENALGVGEHVHILARFPPKLCITYRRKYRGWLKSAGINLVAKAINTKTIGAGVYKDNKCANNQLEHIERLKSYLLKGAHQETLLKYNLRRKRYGGNISQKRCGTTHNLGPAARQQNS